MPRVSCIHEDVAKYSFLAEQIQDVADTTTYDSQAQYFDFGDAHFSGTAFSVSMHST